MLLLQKLKRLDYVVVIILLCFMVMSVFLVYSADVSNDKISIPLYKSIAVDVIGLLGFLVMSLIDYQWLRKISIYLYGSGIFLLVTVYFFGTEIHGAKGWFTLPGGFLFQPAELMKLILIISIATWMSKREGDRLTLKRDVLPIGMIVFFPFILTVIQPDLGNAVIFMLILLGMIWIGNIKYTHVLIGIIIVAGGLYFSYQLYTHNHDALYKEAEKINVEHWMNRIDTFLNPETASDKNSYQVNNSITAIGSGGLAGEGYLKGSSIHRNAIPYAYSDSIFVVVGEEFGFRGAAVLLMMYFLMIYRMIMISIQSVRLIGSYIIVGIVSMFVFQIFENVGMLIGIMPLTGITLPFISYGGTSLLINMLSLGLVMSVRIHQDKDEYETI